VELTILLVSSALGMIIVGVCAVKVRSSGIGRTSPVGPPNWDFSKSWASNITVLGAILAAFFSAKIVVNPRFVSDPGYPMLSVLFALLVVVAPLVFRAISTEKPVMANEGTWDIQYQGNAGGFFLAMFLTLWASLGQLVTLGSLAAEALNGGKVMWLLPTIFLVLLLTALIGMIWYAISTAQPLLEHQSNVGAHAEALVARMQAVGASPPMDFGPTDAPLPGWRLL